MITTKMDQKSESTLKYNVNVKVIVFRQLLTVILSQQKYQNLSERV